MRFTQYFLYTRNRPDRFPIKLEWIESVIKNPCEIKRQRDGRFKKWGFIQEEGKYLRVILLEDEETVHNAFFDRGFKEVDDEN
ncbi:MAG: hypothetical protein PHO08_19660 [Methylococcales bacterium]|nr:hypothetical protein [Methylococcales bacterium]MDD5632021.1 hypothetical protein [Methylococcales bacterium]